MNVAVQFVIRLYTRMLHLYPTSFWEEFAEEMTAVFADSVADAHYQGVGALARLCWQEVADMPYSLMVTYQVEFTYREVIMYRKVDWSVWPSWIVLYLLSIPLAALLMLGMVIIVNGVVPYRKWTTAQYVQLPSLALGFAVVTGTLQWLLLRRYFRHGTLWGLATMLGWLAAGLLAYLSYLTVARLGYSGNALISAGSMFVISGVTIGLFQHWVLRQATPKAGWWIIASAIGYGSLALLVIQPAASILEFVFLIALPAIIIGGALFLLLQQAEVTAFHSGEIGAQLANKPQTKGKQKRVRAAVVILGMALFFLAAPLFWTMGQLTLAKANGIYDTPEESMAAKIENETGGYEIERIEILSAGPNYRDGRLPHVWFVTVKIHADYRPDGKSTALKGYYGGGSFVLKVADGWVHVPEGAFPVLIGRVMAWYGLEDCCLTE